MVRVDDGRNGEHSILVVQHQGINWAVSNQRQVLFKFMILERFHHSKSVNFLVLIQGDEFESSGVFGYILERPLNGVQIMGAN